MESQKSKIITFYSYKGGVGRSMALANIAWLMASEFGMNVLAVDWDLEAPGLHRFLNVQEGNIKNGLIDLFYDYKDLLRQDVFSFREELVKIDQYIIKIPTRKLNGGSISLLPAGRQDREYANRVNEFDWDDFYTNWHGHGFIEYLKNQFKKKADIVLIDSRTGVTDTGGICTLQLPDVVVLLFSMNEQNLSGTEMIIESIFKKSTLIEDKKAPPKLIPIPSRVERYLEKEKRGDWEEKAAERLGKYIPEKEKENPLKYMKKKSIPYDGFFSFGEKLAVKEDPYGELADSINYHTESILEAVGLKEESLIPFPLPESRSSLSEYPARRKINPIIGLILIAIVTIGGIFSYNTFIKKGPQAYALSRIDNGNEYLEKAMSINSVQDKEENINKAVQSFRDALKTITVDEDPYLYAKAQNGLGNAYLGLAGVRDRGKNLDIAIISFEGAERIFKTEEDPFYLAMTKNGLGNAYRGLAEVSDDKEGSLNSAVRFIEEAIEIFSAEGKPFYLAKAQNDLGNTFRDLANIQKKNKEKEELLHRSILTFEGTMDVLNIDEDPIFYAKTQNDLGNAYRELALVQNNEELLERAIFSYQIALQVFNADEYPLYHQEILSEIEKTKGLLRGLQEKRTIQRQRK